MIIGKKAKYFSYDYYRMTGNIYRGRLKDSIQILLRHNLRYMWWYRAKQRPLLGKIARCQLFRYSRKYGLEIHGKSIGKGLYIGHPYNITVGGEVVIGDYCSLHKGCTIGAENRGKRAGSPMIGNHVFIGINATVIGGITIGNDVMIAPNAFVNFDVPDHSVVIENPGVIHHKEMATQGYVNFCEEV